MRRPLLPALLLVVAPPFAAAEGAPHLVQDAAPGTDINSYSGGLSALRSFGGRLLFAGSSDESSGVWSLESGSRSAELLGAAVDGFAFASEGDGFLLWLSQAPPEWTLVTVSDGSPAGTFEASRGPYHSLGYGVEAHIAAPLGGQILFRGHEAATGWEPWVTDGTRAGTRLLADLEPGAGSSFPLAFRALGSRVCFRARTQFEGEFFACSDGTAEGTHRVTPTDLDLTFVDRSAVADGRRLVFAAVREYSDDSTDLYATSGTASSTGRILDLPPNGHLTSDLIELDERVYFVADDVVHGQELWVTDGTPSGTKRVTDFGYAIPFGSFQGRDDIALVGENLFFLATDGLAPTTLWRSDGNPTSTRLAMEALEGCDAPASGLSNVASRISFAQWCDDSGYELRALDPQTGNVSILLDACAGTCDGDPSRPTRVGSHTLFEAGIWDDRELYVTDGTPTGTSRISDVAGGGSHAGWFPWLPALHAGRVWFPASSSSSGFELYSTAFEPGSTRLETDLVSRAASSSPFLLAPLGDGIVFWRCTDFEKRISRSNGEFMDLIDLAASPGVCYDAWSNDESLIVGERVLFVRREPVSQIWGTDGTVAGTSPLYQLYGDWSPFVEDGGVAWWLNFDFDPPEIWRTDGTPAGTRMVVAIPYPLRARRVPPATAGGLFFFVADDEGSDPRVVAFDLVSGQFQVLSPLLEPIYDFVYERLFFLHAGGSIYFLGLEYPGWELWRFDLQARTLALVSDLPVYDVALVGANSWALLLTLEPDSTLVLRRVDGEGLTTLGSLGPMPFDWGNLEDLPSPEAVAAGSWLLFRTQTVAGGVELWATDGTPEGTFALPEPWAGPVSSFPTPPVVAGDAAYFAASDPIHGREVFRLDLVTGALTRLSDVAPGLRSSQVAELAVAGGKLFFGADDGLHGNELWALDLEEEGCREWPHDLCLNQERFQVSAYWRDFFGNAGDGVAVPLTSDTGYLWFFDEANVEVVVKVLDAIGVNQRYWVFYGALSNVEYSVDVFDTATRVKRRYYNLPGRYASVGDTDAFDPFGTVTAAPYNEVEPDGTDGRPVLLGALAAPGAASGSCVPSELRLCLQQGRFAVEAAWRDFQGNEGVGTAAALSADTGYFWFFADSNVEAIVKVLDGRPVNDRFWVYYGALSNVEYTLTVTDTLTGVVKNYFNPAGRFASVGDNDAF